MSHNVTNEKAAILSYNDMQKISKIIVTISAVYFCIFICFYNNYINISFGDDVNVFAKQTIILDFLKERYTLWTSRILIEAPLVFFSKHDVAFRLCNTLIMLFIPVLIYKCLQLNGILYILFSIICFSFYDITYMQSAGIRATFINYMWPIAALFFSHVLFYVWLRTLRNIYVFVAIPILLFACNCEQVCIIAFLFYGLATLVCRFYKHMAFKACLLFTLTALSELIFIITCPGNFVRMHVETLTWLQPFADFTVLQKFFLGVSTTINRYFFQCNSLIIAFWVLLVLLQKTRRSALLTLVPLGCTLAIFISTSVYHVQILHAESLAKETSLCKSGPPEPYFIAEEYFQFWTLAYYAKPENGGLTREQIHADMDHLVATQKKAILQSGLNAWEHYRKFGGKELVNPSNAFDSQNYLEARAQRYNIMAPLPNGSLWSGIKMGRIIADSGLTPLEHYLYFAGTNACEVPSDANFPVPNALAVKTTHKNVKPNYVHFFKDIALADVWPTLWSISMCVFLFLAMKKTTENKQEFMLLLSLLALGFCSRVVLGFSPTLFASSDRTFLFMDLAIISVCTILTRHLQWEGQCLLGLFSIFNTSWQLVHL